MTYASFCRPHRLRAVTLAIFSTVLLAGGSAMASDNLAVKTLTEQARFWENKGRTDLSSTAWKRLLQIQPNNPDALAGLAQFELDNNRMDAARALTDQLKQLPEGNSEAIKRVETATAQKAVNTPLLEQARAAAKAGRADDAVGLYRQAFDGRAISGPVALEYYQTLGGTSQGWEEARSGLEKLRADEPKNGAAGLAYAQHLTYRASTRREGIRLLAELSREPQYARPAIEAWKKALVWLDAGQADLSLFQTYLKAQPDDGAVRSRMMSLGKAKRPVATATVPRPDGLADGFAALNAGDVATAEQQFEKLLSSNPKNAEALGGMGVVRLRQERFTDAENSLASAMRISGSKKWADALNTSRFWIAMRAGDAAVNDGRFDQAIEAYERARRLDPKATAPQLALIDAMIKNDQFVQAQSLVDAMPDGVERRDAALLLVKRKASKAFEEKQYAEAERLLSERAVSLDPEGRELLAWARFHQGKASEAWKNFVDLYQSAPSKGAAAGLVISAHALKDYQNLLALVRVDSGLLREFVPDSVQAKISQGETLFTVGSDGRLAEVDPLIIFNRDIVQPATTALLTEKNPKKAYDLLLPVERNLLENADYGNLALLGMAATQVGDQNTAMRVLKKAAEETEDEAFYRVWAESLVTFGRDQEAEALMIKQAETLDSEGLMLLGWTQTRLGKHDQAIERFAAAYAKNPTVDGAQALVYSSVQTKKFPLLLAALNKHPKGPLDALVEPDIRTRIAAGEQRFGAEANARLVVLRGTSSESDPEGFSLKLEPRLRSKSGAAGEGKLRQGSVVATLGWRGESQHANLEWERQNATDLIDRANGQRWYAKWGMKMTPSLGVELGVGQTLSGGVVSPATVGEVGVSYSSTEGGVGARLFRRGSEESLLALAGTPDVATGLHWGRALESGLALNAFYKDEDWNNLGSLVFARLGGRTIADNDKVEFYGRALRSVEGVSGLSLGPELYFSQYKRNLSNYEPGHGGYFSPALSITLGAAARYETNFGKMALTLTGGLGWGYNREGTAAGNPITGIRPGQYPGATGKGLAYHGRIEGLQLLSPIWNVGFGMGVQRSPYFSDWRANVFVQRRWLH